MVKGKADQLEKSLTQLVDYQTQIQELRKKIIQEEQQLRQVMAPTYLPHDREKATTEQQVRFSTIHLLLFFFFFLAIFHFIRFLSSERFEVSFYSKFEFSLISLSFCFFRTKHHYFNFIY